MNSVESLESVGEGRIKESRLLVIQGQYQNSFFLCLAWV